MTFSQQIFHHILGPSSEVKERTYYKTNFSCITIKGVKPFSNKKIKGTQKNLTKHAFKAKQNFQHLHHIIGTLLTSMLIFIRATEGLAQALKK